MAAKLWLIFVVIIGGAIADLAKFKKCQGYDDSICEVTEVRITPCSNPSNCRLKKGTSTNIEFDYIPKFSADQLLTSVNWMSSVGDQAFETLNGANSCNYTSCPIEADKKQKFSYDLFLERLLPSGTYPLKWKLWDANDNSTVCCFRVNIKLVK